MLWEVQFQFPRDVGGRGGCGRYAILAGMKRKKAKIAEGYTLSEMRELTNRMVDESAERLRRRLRAAWKRQTKQRARIRHGVAV